ncbi:MAG TPA: serine/threonine-protein kinase, partial [Myxococcaceae bacterium]|nr:serine/threonine-protein kinase [Myxococcaceae bacterium]
MGVVYLAYQPDISKAVAIKVLNAEAAGDPDHTRRLVEEARATSAIRHRGIIDVYGFGKTPQGHQYLVMEYLEGEPLDAYLARFRKLHPAEVVAILDDVLAALAAAHKAGVVHRDIKPGNVFLSRQSDGTREVKVLDFGLAKRIDASRAVAAQTGFRACGTPAYIAPEQAMGQSVGPPADLYSVGAMAFELVTGRLPFEAPSVVEILMMQVQSPPPRARQLDPAVPGAIEELILQLMEKAPQARPRSAEQVRASLKQIRRELADSETQVQVLEVDAEGKRQTQEAPEQPNG